MQHSRASKGCHWHHKISLSSLSRTYSIAMVLPSHWSTRRNHSNFIIFLVDEHYSDTNQVEIPWDIFFFCGWIPWDILKDRRGKTTHLNISLSRIAAKAAVLQFPNARAAVPRRGMMQHQNEQYEEKKFYCEQSYIIFKKAHFGN